MNCGRLLAVWLTLGASAAWSGEPGVLLKRDELKAEPFRDARTLGALAKDDKVEILKKDGGWLRVKSPRGEGWVRMLSVRRSGAGGGNSAKGLIDLASGRTGTGQVVSSTGIRGLDEEQLKAAQVNAVELKKLDAVAATPEQARRFAQQGKLVARRVDPLPAPVPVAGSGE